MAASLLPVHALDRESPRLSPATWNLRLVSVTPELVHKEVFAHDPESGAAAPLVPAELGNKLPGAGSHAMTRSGKLVFTTDRDRRSLHDPLLRLGEVTLPENTRTAVIVFAPVKDPAPGAKWAVAAVNDSPGHFPAGSMAVVNTSAVPVRFLMEEKKFDLNQGETSVIRDSLGDKEGKTIKFRFLFQLNKEWRPTVSGFWPRPVKTRSLVAVGWEKRISGYVSKLVQDPAAP